MGLILGEIVECIETLTFRLIAVLTNAAPAPVRSGIAGLCAGFDYCFSRAQRKNVAENMRIAGLRPTPGRVFGVFKLRATNIIEMFAASLWKNETILERFALEGRDRLDEALGEGKGVILVSAHTGSWELGARCLQALGYRLHVVAGIQMNRFFTGPIRETKKRWGIEVVSPDGSYRKLLKALASNGVVILLVDGNIYTGGADVPFFGRRTRLPEGPVRLSRTSGAPILGGYCRRLGNAEHELLVERILGGREVASLSDRDALEEMYRKVERHIERNADQWCMFRRLWGA